MSRAKLIIIPLLPVFLLMFCSVYIFHDVKLPLYKSVILYSIIAASSTILFFTCYHSWVAARRSARDALFVKSRLQSVQDTIQDGLVVMSEDGIIQNCNLAIEKILGFNREELIGQDVTILMPEKEKSRHAGYVHHYMETGEKKIIGRGREVLAMSKKKEEIPVFLTINEFPDIDKGQERVFVGVIRDLSKITASEAQVEQLSRRLIAVQEEERSRLSGVIHDEVGQMLFAMKLSMQSLISDIRAGNQIDDNRTDELLRHMTQTISEVRNISHSISPIRLKSLGLARAIAELADSVATRCKIKIQTFIDHLDSYFENGWDINVYRIIQEAVTNAVKHGNPSVIKILSRLDADNLMIEIEDDGKGFQQDTTSARDGLGLSLMRQRALLIEGNLSIQSSQGSGTRIVFTLPRELLI